MDESQLKKFLTEFQKVFEDKFKAFQQSINAQLEVIRKNQKAFQESLDIMDRDMSHDRANIDSVLIKQGSIDAQFEEFRTMFSHQTKKIQETVQNVVTEQVEPVSSQVQELKDIFTTD